MSSRPAFASSSSASAVRFLTAAHVQRLHARLIAPQTAQPTQPGLLASAVASPVNHYRYGATRDVFQLAGVLAEKIALDHAFQDGNKRTSLFAADVFLQMNGHRLAAPQQRGEEPTGEKETTGTPGSESPSPSGKTDPEFDEEVAQAQVAVATHRWSAADVGRHYERIAQPRPSVPERRP